MTEYEDLLRTLAAEVGILPEYYDLSGTVRHASDATRESLLGCMGYDVATEVRLRETIKERERRAKEEGLPPVRVVQESTSSLSVELLRGKRPEVLDESSGRWRLTLRAEDGSTHTTESEWGGAVMPERLYFSRTAPRGYHEVELLISAGGREMRFEQTLIVVPGRCYTPALAIGDDRAFGILSNLYTLRSERNWGVGDLGDLAELFRWAGEHGAAFVGINPLHALLNRGGHISPYSPISRLFRNPIYLAIEDVPERDHAATLDARLGSTEMQALLRGLREEPNVDYEQVMAAKGLALDALYGVFLSRRDPRRWDAFHAYVAEHEPELTRFATWMTLWETHSAPSPYRDDPEDRRRWNWFSWPRELRRPDSPEVHEFAARHADRVQYHRWVQFEIDRQLKDATTRGDLRIGLYQDLAVGCAPDGADTWAYPELFVADSRASIGAPPDPYSATGQNWGLPPMNPEAMRRNRYRYFIQMVRANLRHTGALRIDHVMGLFRQFWIPPEGTAADGAYVRYPAEDLLGIIALESIRHRAVIVGEDLGTVPPEVPEAMSRWGVLSSRVMYFLKDSYHPGEFAPPAAYPANALSTANTHDLPPINGFWIGRDIAIREQAGVLTADEARQLPDDREREKTAFIRRLYRSHVLPENAMPATMAELRGAVHAFLCTLESQLVGISLDDLTGEVDPVNVPGLRVDQWPCWTRKMHTPVTELGSSPEVATALRCETRAAKQ